MKKVKYYYNPGTKSYEKLKSSYGRKFIRFFGFICSVALSAFLIVSFVFQYLESPKEKQLKRDFTELESNYKILNSKLNQMSTVLEKLEERDDNIYRVIFEAEPISPSIRNAGIGGINPSRKYESFENAELFANVNRKANKLQRQLYIQSKSYDDISKMIVNKSDMLQAIPSIMPVSNENLIRTASGFGMRIDPIYKVRKMHHGMDFTAPTGSEVYSTGNGTVSKVTYMRGGYGRHVKVDHGYGYSTLYAHLSKATVRVGQKINRGELIGLVGSTGKSTAPHLHYEVRINNSAINPANYYFNDLNPEQYEQMLQLSATHGQSFD